MTVDPLFKQQQLKATPPGVKLTQEGALWCAMHEETGAWSAGLSPDQALANLEETMRRDGVASLVFLERDLVFKIRSLIEELWSTQTEQVVDGKSTREVLDLTANPDLRTAIRSAGTALVLQQLDEVLR